MQTFKKLIPFLIIFAVVNILLGVLFHSASYVRVALHELQSSEEEYKIVFVGQSHGANAFNPYIIEEKTGMPAYNLCTALTAVRDVAYLVKESNYKNDVDYIIYDIDSAYWTGFEKPNYFADGYVYPHLNNPVNKLDYFMKYSLNENFRYSLCRYVVYGTGGIKKIPENLKRKLSMEYLNYDINSVLSDFDKKAYKGRGFFSLNTYGDGEFTPVEWKTEDVKDGNLQGFSDMVSYCKENDIELICVSSPLPAERTDVENYPAVHDYFAELTEEYNIAFWDFNYINEDYLSWTSDEFHDLDGHMLGVLADRYSTVLGEMLARYCEGTNVDYYFEY